MVAYFKIAFVLIALQALPLTYGCETGWFGCDCQYRCHCPDNNCGPEGQCLDGSPCVRGWFGPSCQYADLASTSHVVRNKQTITELTDGDESTCLNGGRYQATLSWTRRTAFELTWIRVYFSKNMPNNLSFEFRNDVNSTKSPNFRQARISDTAYEIHFDLNHSVKNIILEGAVKFLCSVYVSGGRNVALKQNTNQSTNYNETHWLSSNAVDGALGDTNIELANSCSRTALNDNKPNLNVIFPYDVAVNRYVLYNKAKEITGNDTFPNRNYFLKSYSRDGQLQFNDTGPNRPTEVETVFTTTAIIATTNIEHHYKQGQIKQKLLTMCEIEIYGESVCQPGKYGRECEHSCKCATEGEACFVSSGACPSGCAAGFSGEGCRTRLE